MCSCVPFALRQSRTRSCRNGGTTDTSTRALVDFANFTGNRVLMPGDHQIIFGTATLGSREICRGTMSRSSDPMWSDAACCACVVCRVVGYRVATAHGHAWTQHRVDHRLVVPEHLAGGLIEETRAPLELVEVEAQGGTDASLDLHAHDVGVRSELAAVEGPVLREDVDLRGQPLRAHHTAETLRLHTPGRLFPDARDHTHRHASLLREIPERRRIANIRHEGKQPQLVLSGLQIVEQ